MASGDLSRLKIDKSSPDFGKKKKRQATQLVAAAVVMVIAAVLFIRSGSSVVVETAVVARVYPSQAFTILNASGYVAAQRRAAVASKATGRLEWIGVEEGSKVKKNQVIARLENQDVIAAREQASANLMNARAALEEARAELDVAALNFNRNRELVDKGFIPRMDFDSAEARYKRAQAAVNGADAAVRAAEAALRSAEVAVEYTLIRAPFDAVVLTKDADVGDIVTPLGAAANAKAAVVTIADLFSLEVETDVAESNLSKVCTGQSCEIQLDALPDKRFRGVVHMIVPTADRSKASVMVKVRFVDRDSHILPEMSARVSFLERPALPEERAPRTAVSPAALIDKNGKKVAYIVTNGRAKEVVVTSGHVIGDLVEAASGLEPGDRVVLNPPKGLKDGAKVKLKKE